jgi:hypothetical protein
VFLNFFSNGYRDRSSSEHQLLTKLTVFYKNKVGYLDINLSIGIGLKTPGNTIMDLRPEFTDLLVGTGGMNPVGQ